MPKYAPGFWKNNVMDMSSVAGTSNPWDKAPPAAGDAGAGAGGGGGGGAEVSEHIYLYLPTPRPACTAGLLLISCVKVVPGLQPPPPLCVWAENSHASAHIATTELC